MRANPALLRVRPGGRSAAAWRSLRCAPVAFALLAVGLAGAPAADAVPGPTGTGAIVENSGCYAYNLGRNDDSGSSAYNLGFTVNWFGVNRSTITVNNNGGIALDGSGFSQYSGVYIPTFARPIVVAAFADLDTRNSLTSPVTWGPLSGTFEGRTGFCVMWANVGYYPSSSPALSAQILILNRSDRRAGDFDIVMNYNWVSGSRALEVGFTSGTAGSNWYRFAGSGSAGAFADGSATALTRFNSVPAEYSEASRSKLGRYVFQSINGAVAVASGPGTPGSPTNVTATAGAGQATVSWTAPTSTGASALTDYTIEFSANNGSSWSTFADGTSTATQTTVTGLTNGTAYIFRVTARNSYGTGAASAASTAVTPATVPAAPSSLVGTPADASASIAFTAGSANGSTITNYKYSLNGGAYVALNPADATSPITIPGLVNGTTYQVRLRAVNGMGDGAESPAVSVTPRTTPAAPTGLTTSGGAGSITVAFTPGADGGAAVTNYKYSLNGGAYIALSPADATSPITITGLTNGQSYSVRLRAVNAAGDGTESAAVTGVAQGTPGAPASLTATPGNGQVVLSWPDAADNGSTITDYQVQFSATGGASWATFADGVSPGTGATVTGLANGTAYLFRVAGVNAQGTGAWATSASTTPRTVPDAPTGVTPGTPTDGAVPLSWTAPAGTGGSVITDYVVEYAPGPGFSLWSAFADGVSTTTSTTVTGLANGTAYRFRVSAVNVAGTGSAATGAATGTPRRAPDAPQAVAVALGNGELVVTWTAPASDGGSAVTAYTATATAGATSRSCAWTTGAFTCTITGLANGTAYVVRVTATNAAGTGTASTGVSSTPRTTPSAVSTISRTPGDGQVELSWAEPADGGAAIADYVVQFSSNGGIGWSTFADGAAPGTGATVTGLDNGTPYVFRVAATNAAGQGAYSAASAASTPRTAPDAPRGVTGAPADREVTLTWSVPASNGGDAITDYIVEYSSGGGWQTAADGTSTATSATVTGLTNGTAYDFRVTAVNAAGPGAAGAAPAVTPRTVPSRVGTVSATPQSTAVQLSWTAPGNGGAAITDYVVRYRTSPSGAWTIFADGTSATAAATVTGLTNGTAYDFAVSAVNPAGAGAESVASTATPRTTPDAPPAPTASAGDRQVALDWDEPSENGGSTVTDYVVEYSSGSGWLSFDDGVSSATQAVVTGLANGMTYEFRVSAVNAAGTGAASASSASATPFQAPGPPRNVTAVAGSTEVALSWAPPTSTGGSPITDYVIQVSAGPGFSSWTTFADAVSTATAATVTGLTNGVAYRFRVAARNARGTGSATALASDLTVQAPGAYVDTTGDGGGWTLLGYAENGALGGLLTAVNGSYDAAVRTGSANLAALAAVQAADEMAITWNQTGTPTGGVLSYTHGIAFALPSASSMDLAGTNPDPSVMQAVAIRELGAATGLATTQYLNPITLGLNYGSSYGLTNDRANWGPDGQARQAVYLAHGGYPGNQYARAYVTSNGTGAGYLPSTMAIWVRGLGSVTPRTTPAAPVAPTVASVGDGSVELNWSAPSDGGAGISDYLVERAAFDGSDCGPWTTFADGIAPTTAATVTGLTNGSRYCFRITAVNVAGSGPASPALEDVVPYTTPAAPTITTATPGDGSATLLITAGADNGSTITTYAYSTDNGATYTELSPADVTSPIVIPGLANGTPYTVRVRAVNAAGQGDASNAALVTPRTTPGIPTLVTATAGVTSARVTWSAPASTGGAPIVGYTVEATVGGSVVTSLATTDTSAFFGSLTADRPVTFTVRATNAAGSGDATSPTSPITPYALPDAPTAVTTGALGDGSVVLTWTAGADNGAEITDYAVQYSEDGGTSWATQADGVSPALEATVRGLENGTSYVFRVLAVNAAGTGAASDPSGSAVPRSAPGAPSVAVSAGSETATAADFAITAPASTGGSPITDYEYSVDGGAWTSTANATAFTASGLNAGRAFAVRVRAVNVAGSGPASVPATATTLPGAPSVVEIVAGDEALSADVAAAAGDQAAIADWQFAYSDDSGGSWTVFDDAVSTTPTVTISTGSVNGVDHVIQNGTNYVVRARARNASGWGAWSAPSASVRPVEVSVRVPSGAAAGTTVPMGQWSIVRETLGSSVRLIDFPGDGSGIVQALVTTTGDDAYLKLGSTTGLQEPTGHDSAAWTSGSATLISFQGTLANVNAALKTLMVRPTASTGADEMIVNVHGVLGNQAYYAVNGGAGIQSGRFYEVVDHGSGISVHEARCQAKYGNGRYNSGLGGDRCEANPSSGALARRTLHGLDGYLATVTSGAENAFLDNITDWSTGNNPGRYWLGGSDEGSEGTWKWWDGPEAGAAFTYTSWASGEPNNSSNEDYVEFAFGGSNTWNDASESGPQRYLIEYGGESDDVGIQQAVASFTVQASQRPVNTGRPAAAAAAVPARTQVTASAGSWTGLDTTRNGTYFRGTSTYDASNTVSTDVPGPWTARSRQFSSTDAVSVLDQSGLDLSASSDADQQSFTFETWVKRPADGSGMLLNKESAFELAIMNADGELAFAIMPVSTSWDWIDTDVFIPADRWTHVAYVKSGRTVTIYVDGQRAFRATDFGYRHQEGVGQGAAVITIPAQVRDTNGTLTLGGRSGQCQDQLPTSCAGYGQYLTGKLSDARLWTTARSQAEIEANMRRRIASDILTWNLDEASGTVAVNSALYVYQWQMAAEEEGRYVNVAGADAQSYTPTTADVGRWLRVRVMASNSAGVTSAFSEPRQIAAGAPAAPTNVTVTPSGTTMTVTWSPPADDGGAAITTYTVTGSPSGGCTATAPATTCIVSGLTPATAYTYTVTAENSAGTGDASSASASTYAALTAPTGLTATRGDRSLSLSWTAPADPSSSLSDYRIRYSSDAGVTWTTWAHAPSTATSAVIPGLDNGTPYRVEVAAINVAGVGAAVTASGTPSSVPAAPTVNGASNGDGGGTLRVTPGSDGGSAITNYAYSLDGGATWIPLSPATTGTPAASGVGVDLAIPGTGNPALANGTVYTVLLRAVNAVGSGPASAAETIRPRTTPGAPTGVTATAGDASATVTWLAPASDGGAEISNITVTADPGGRTCSPLAGEPSCTVTGLDNGTAYTFTARAANPAGSGPASTASAAVTPRTVPGAARSLAAEADDGRVALTWTVPLDIGGATVGDYLVEYRVSGAATWTRYDEARSAVAATTVIGLDNGTEYEFRVAAVNAAGTGPFTGAITATPGTRPQAPTVGTIAAGDGQITITWGALNASRSGGSAITGYQYSLDNGATWTTIPNSSGQTTYTISGLVNGTDYGVRLRAVNATGPGTGSDAQTALPLGRADAPTQLTATSLDGAVEIAFTAGDPGGNALSNYEYSTDDGTTWRALSPADAVSPVTLSRASADGTTLLVNGTSYAVKLRAVTDAPGALQPAVASAAVSATPVGPPEAPASIGATPGDADAVVTWALPPNDGGSPITDYVLEYSLNDGNNWTTVSDGTSTARTYTVGGLVNGTATLLRVAAVTRAGTGPWRQLATAITPRTAPGAPTAVTATPGNGSAVISWTAPASDGGVPLSGYTATAWNPSSVASGTCAPTNPATGTSCEITGLENGTAYTFTVTATNVGNLTGPASSASDPVTPRTTPGVPRSLAVDPGNGSLALTWAAPASDGGLPIVRYEYSRDAGANWTAIPNSASATSYTVAGLDNGTAYLMQLRAVTSFGEGAATGSVSGTPRTVPDAPTMGAPTPTDQGADVTWTAPAWDGGSAITGYTLEISSDNGATWDTVSPSASTGVRVTGATATGASVLGLVNGTPYVFRVIAANAAGTGVASAASGSVTPRATPTAPAITAVTPDDRSVDLAWDPPTSDGGNAVSDYRVSYRPAAGGSWTALGTVAGSDPYLSRTSATIGIARVLGLANGTAYVFRVEAANEAGYGAASPVSSAVTPRTVPSAPSGLAVAPGDGEVVLTFTPGDTGGADLENYEYSIDQGSSYIAFGPATTGTDAGGGQRSLVVGNLTNGTAYSFRIRAINAAGSGAATADVTTTPRRVPDAPSRISGEPGPGSATITFAAGADGGNAVANYEYTTDGGASWTALVPADASSPVTVTGLENGTTYEIGLRAVNEAGAGAASTETAIVRPRTTPSAPTGISTESLDGAIRVYFTPGATGGATITNYEHTYSTSTDGQTWSAWSAWTALSPADDLSPIRVTGLVNGTKYRFRVRAVNEAGPGAASSEEESIAAVSSPEATPAPLTLVSVAAADRSAVVVFQNDFVTGQMPVRLQHSVDGGASWREFSPATLGTEIAGGSQRTLTITGLVNGQTYPIMLRGANNAGEGADSNAISVTPVAPPAPPVEVTPVEDDAQLALTVIPGDNGGAPITDIEYTLDGGATWQSSGARARTSRSRTSRTAAPTRCAPVSPTASARERRAT